MHEPEQNGYHKCRDLENGDHLCVVPLVVWDYLTLVDAVNDFLLCSAGDTEPKKFYRNNADMEGKRYPNREVDT